MFTVTKVTMTSVNVETFDDYDEAWAALMRTGVEPEVVCATMDIIVQKNWAMRNSADNFARFATRR